jgi:hypothetical protein
MPVKYPPEAVERCLRLYLRFNGGQYRRIEAEMRKLWPRWSRHNLLTRGKGDSRIPGWVEKYNWKEALRLHLEQSPQAALRAAAKLVDEVEFSRRTLFAEISSQGAAAGKDTISQHLKYCGLSMEARTKVDNPHDTIKNFADFWEKLLDWLMEIDRDVTRALLSVSDKIIERMEKEYVKDRS